MLLAWMPCKLHKSEVDVAQLEERQGARGRLLLLLQLSLQSRPPLRPQRRQPTRPPTVPGFSRQERCSGLPCPSPMHQSEVAQSYLTLRGPMDCSLPGSSIHGIFQARVLELDTIAFSGKKASSYS